MLQFPQVWGQPSGGLPAVTRATGLITGLIRQMSLEVWEGAQLLPQTPFVRRPDPTAGRAWWVGQHVDDFLMHGNAVHIVTSRDELTGLPTSTMWVPAEHVGVTRDGAGIAYWVGGVQIPNRDVVHVRRKADRNFPARGIGVVEEHLTTFRKLHHQSEYESGAYTNSGIPSVVVETPNTDLSQEEADEAKDRWMERFARREPVILPSGTKVHPLAWNPSDSQMVEAHEMSNGDVANMFNLDSAWLGVSTRGMTYKSLSPLFLQLVRETIDPIADDFEQIWGPAWLMPGQELRFAKSEILGDDMATEVDWIVKAIEAGLIDEDEGRSRIGYAPRSPASAGEPTTGADAAREAAEVAQKVYLAVASDVLTRPEGRDLIRRAGANLEGDER